MTVATACPLSTVFRATPMAHLCSAALNELLKELHPIGIELYHDIDHFDSLDPTARRWSNLDAISGVWLVWNLKGERPSSDECFEGALVGIALAYYANQCLESAMTRSFAMSKFDVYAIVKHICQLER
jgi:hypothetical protein